MRKITVAFTAAALAVSMLAAAIPAAASVTGYDSAYAGESAFVSLAPGQSNEFQVFFANTGSTTWARGTSTEVDLAACLADKVTCNAQDASEAPFNSGWLSATRYATTTQTAVSPGSIATFKYTVLVPAGTASGTYRFNGDLVQASSGATIHPEGYFQDVTVGGGGTGAAATLVAISPATGDIGGGTVVTLSGTNFACTPSFPGVDFGGAAGTVTSCGSTAMTVTAPAHAAGTVNVTVTNAGAGPSNSLLFTFKDTTAPTLKQINASGGTNVVQVAFSESVCNNAPYLLSDWVVTVNGNPVAVTGVRRPQGTDLTTTTGCDLGRGQTAGANVLSMTAVDLIIGTTLTTGDFVTATATCSGAADTFSPCTAGAAGKTQDLAGNVMQSAQTVTGTAIGDTTKPSIASTTTLSSTSIRLTYNEPVTCDNTGQAQFTITTGGNSFTPTTLSCASLANGGATRVTLTSPSDVSAGGFVTYQESATATQRIKDLAGNNAVSPQTISFAAIAAATPPVISDAHVVANVGSTDFGDTGDSFSLTFNEAMNTNTTGNQVAVIDNDPSTTKTSNTFVCGAANTCSWNAAGTVFTVTVVTPVAGTGGGGSLGLQLPLTITATTGLTDLDDNAPPNLAASDKSIE